MSNIPLTPKEAEDIASRAKPYDFNVKLKSAKGHEIGVDTAAGYGYWEWPDGSEGGGLWFESSIKGEKKLELMDADGHWELPKTFVTLLRENGFIVGTEFD